MYKIYYSVESEPVFKGIKGRQYIYLFFGLTVLLVVIGIFFIATSFFITLFFLACVLVLYVVLLKKSKKNKFNVEKRGIEKPQVISVRSGKIYQCKSNGKEKN